MKTLPILGAASLALITAPAFAAVAPHSVVVVPWGAWVNEVLRDWTPSILFAMGTVATWLIARMTGPFGTLLRTFVTQNMIDGAIHSGLASIEGAVAGQKLELSVANRVAAHAEQHAIASFPRVAHDIGEMLRPLILARMSAMGLLPPESSSRNLSAPAPRIVRR